MWVGMELWNNVSVQFAFPFFVILKFDILVDLYTIPILV